MGRGGGCEVKKLGVKMGRELDEVKEVLRIKKRVRNLCRGVR